MEAPEELIGKTIGHYRISHLLARGGMACVYRAKHLIFDRDCVIKTMTPEAKMSPEKQARFLREIRTSAKLNHPNIVVFHDAGMEKDFFYLVMEFFNGRNIEQLYKEKPASPEQAVQIGKQIASALVAAHNLQIIHRDIKPRNVLVNRIGLAKVLDFGMSKILFNPSIRPLTKPGEVLGSPKYMAPEQLRDPTGVDSRVDIYATGVVLYFCLTGHAPYEAETIIEIVRMVGGPFPPPRKWQPNVPREFEEIVLKAMARRPRDRYESAAKLLAALEEYQAGADTSLHAALSEVELYTQPADGGDPVGHAPALESLDAAPSLPRPEPAERPEAFLRIFSSDGYFGEVELVTDRTVIGRGRHCDIRLNTSQVSRRHAVIRFDGTRYIVEDLSSRSGTFVNRKKIRSAVLHDGDAIQILDSVLEYHTKTMNATLADTVVDKPTGKQLETRRFSLLPDSVAMRYRVIGVEPGEVFRKGDTVVLGKGGVIILTDQKLKSGSTLEVELTWPDGGKRMFLAEVVRVVEARSGLLGMLFLHKLDQGDYRAVLEDHRRGGWVQCRSMREER